MSAVYPSSGRIPQTLRAAGTNKRQSSDAHDVMTWISNRKRKGHRDSQTELLFDLIQGDADDPTLCVLNLVLSARDIRMWLVDGQ